MDNAKKKRAKSRRSRVLRVRKKLTGSTERPRLTVSKTNRHIYAQIIDDSQGITLAGVGTLSTNNQKGEHNRKSKEAAFAIGQQLGEMAKQKNVEKVVFDRGRYSFHGIVAEIAAGARKAGLDF